MEKNTMLQFSELLEAFGMELTILKSAQDSENGFDRGLRKKMFDDYNYREITDGFEAIFEEYTLYMIKDSFEEHYIMFKVPEQFIEDGIAQFAFIGPYLLEEQKKVLTIMARKDQVPINRLTDLKEYYYGVPLIESKNILETFVIIQAGYVFGGKDKVIVNRIEDFFDKKISLSEKQAETDNQLKMSVVEERYSCEDGMLRAVEQGKQEEALSYYRKLSKFRTHKRATDGLWEAKIFMIVMNTLLRKAVQGADVHPIHIDDISRGFAKRIEVCIKEQELFEFSREMIRKYCLLVRNHSLRGYSKIIQNAINFIVFNLAEPITLSVLAEMNTVNASYFSAQFKRETGTTLTDYINQKRIYASKVLLATTDLPIQEIAERVGFLDESYFSRLFKKLQNQTPKQYRNLMQSKV